VPDLLVLFAHSFDGLLEEIGFESLSFNDSKALVSIRIDV